MSSTLFSRPALEFGVYSQGVTPVTIPNTVVKTLNAYGTAEVTRWESRAMPNSNAGWGNNIFEFQARSSEGEHYLDTVGVVGSIPTVPTKSFNFTGGDHRHS